MLANVIAAGNGRAKDSADDICFVGRVNGLMKLRVDEQKRSLTLCLVLVEGKEEPLSHARSTGGMSKRKSRQEQTRASTGMEGRTQQLRLPSKRNGASECAAEWNHSLLQHRWCHSGPTAPHHAQYLVRFLI
jgi:hypothetical protein